MGAFSPALLLSATGYHWAVENSLYRVPCALALNVLRPGEDIPVLAALLPGEYTEAGERKPQDRL
jgi:hypothetical protein